MTFFNLLSIQASNMILAENSIGTNIMIAGDRKNNSIFHKNMVFISLARKDCTECYANSNMCEDQIAFRLAAIQVSGEEYPLHFKKSPLEIVNLCKEGAFDKKAYLNNVEFINYRMSYGEKIWAKCNSNRLFTTLKQATDGSASLFISDTVCKNCEKESFVKWFEPDKNKIGWKGGCGNMVCTGQRNILISDLDGKLFNKGNVGSQLIPFIPGIDFSKFPGCYNYSKYWNGYECLGKQLGIITFESTATDKRDRIISPVNIYRKNFNNSLNMLNEWSWDG